MIREWKQGCFSFLFSVTMGVEDLQPDPSVGIHLTKQDSSSGLHVPVDTKMGTFSLKGWALAKQQTLLLCIYACL